MSAEVLQYAAFADDVDGGNPAGVVLDADALTAAQMLAIAEAIGFSETAFVTEGGHGLRFFSPKAEVAFCGHATIATAVAMAERDGAATRELATAAGVVAVEVSGEPGALAATFASPATSTRPAPEAVVSRALAALGWSRDELDARYPVHVANAGNDHLMLGLSRLETLAGFDYDYASLAALMEQEGWTTVHAFVARERDEFRARNAFPPGGVHEDPATGAAAAAFAAYLRDLGLLTPPGRITIHQGVELGRPSVIVAEVLAGDPRVRITGRAVRLALSPYDGLGRP
jgi:PhzF family phenazine biosynthesis protein